MECVFSVVRNSKPFQIEYYRYREGKKALNKIAAYFSSQMMNNTRKSKRDVWKLRNGK